MLSSIRVRTLAALALLVTLGGLMLAAPAGAQTLTTVRVAMIPIEAAATVYYAKENGFF